MILKHTSTMTKKKHFLKLEQTTPTIKILTDAPVLKVIELSPGKTPLHHTSCTDSQGFSYTAPCSRCPPSLAPLEVADGPRL